jgi:hypothetical protein
MGTNASLIISIFFADGLLVGANYAFVQRYSDCTNPKVWRLYVIWQNMWIAILPALMWLSGTSAYSFAQMFVLFLNYFVCPKS